VQQVFRKKGNITFKDFTKDKAAVQISYITLFAEKVQFKRLRDSLTLFSHTHTLNLYSVFNSYWFKVRNNFPYQ